MQAVRPKSPGRYPFAVATACLALLGASSNLSAGTASVDTDRSAKLQQLNAEIERLVTEGHTAGISFAIQVRKELRTTGAYGVRDLRDRARVHESDRFRIASITKTITATAVLKLTELGKLSLRDPISKMFPEYPNGERITIYHLLSHTSGIPNWWEGELPSDAPEDFPMCSEPHRYLQRMTTASLFEPGEFYKYSNSGYVLLGEIIEKISGHTYERFVADRIFTPAGMQSTQMEYIERPSSSWVQGYVGGEGATFSNPEVYHMPFSAGGLRSTATDLLNFLNALLAGRIISDTLVQQMTSYARLNDGRRNFEAPFIAPGSSPPQPREGISNSGYGLGFNLTELYGTPVYRHSGGIAGFNSLILHVPKNGVTIVLLANTENGLVPGLQRIRKLVTEIP